VNSPATVPIHIAIVMDGNGRWAKKRFLPRVAGHKQGVEALRRTVQACLDRQVGVLSVFAFSSENWSRPADEVSGLMELLAIALSREVPSLHERGVQIHFPGDRSRLSIRVAEGLSSAEKLTANNTKLVLNVCFNYGGRWDICQAAESLRKAGQAITEEALGKSLALAHVPDPDLFIRTGGELRVSNFLIWQMAYAEFYFSPVLWPDFNAQELDQAITVFRSRERRFGQTSEQLVGAAHGMKPGDA
jgi:undecaprenyl diphosphate synthase